MTDNDSPSAQLDHELWGSLHDALANAPRRPLLHHLNADTSWLLQIPRPASLQPENNRRRSKLYEGSYFYNVLIDPWLSGSQIDFFKWFSQQWHRFPPACPDVAAVRKLIGRVEALMTDSGAASDDDAEGKIDVVLISHEFTDHCHRETLSQIDPDVPILATTKAAQIITSWKQFRSVTEVPHFFPKSRDEKQDTDWRTRSVRPLPEWLSISRLVTSWDASYLHAAVMIAFNFENDIYGDTSATAEAIVYTPHGIPASAVKALNEAQPPIRTLALIHGLFKVAVSRFGTINLGARNGLEVQRQLQARYWMRTHDEDKKGEGLIGWLLRKKKWTVEEAVEEFEREHGGEKKEKPHFLEVRNGESTVLT